MHVHVFTLSLRLKANACARIYIVYFIPKISLEGQSSSLRSITDAALKENNAHSTQSHAVYMYQERITPT